MKSKLLKKLRSKYTIVVNKGKRITIYPELAKTLSSLGINYSDDFLYDEYVVKKVTKKGSYSLCKFAKVDERTMLASSQFKDDPEPTLGTRIHDFDINHLILCALWYEIVDDHWYRPVDFSVDVLRERIHLKFHGNIIDKRSERYYKPIDEANTSEKVWW